MYEQVKPRLVYSWQDEDASFTELETELESDRDANDGNVLEQSRLCSPLTSPSILSTEVDKLFSDRGRTRESRREEFEKNGAR